MELIIKNRKGKEYIVFYDEDFHELVIANKWHITCEKNPYAATWNNRTRLFMHILILNPDPNMEGDHKNHNTLDNRTSNLRVATRQQNAQNRRSFNKSTSKYYGVCLPKPERKVNKWKAQIKVDGEIIFLGRHPTEETAAIAYDSAARNHFGEFANLNFK